MMHERFEPMPEELAVAHQGRIAHFIGTQNEQKFNSWLKQKIALEAPSSVRASRLNQLAVVSGLSSSEYARMHSMLGVLRFAAQPNALGDHGNQEGEAFSKRIGMCRQKKAAYLCLDCVREDLEHWKFSWFRRSHHLLGVDWCPSHRTPLVKVKSSEPWLSLPQHWVEKGDIEHDLRLTRDLDVGSFEFRFGEIACAMLGSRGPIDVSKLRQKLVARGQQLGLRVSDLGQKPLVSDHICRVAESAWLKRVWPEVLQKKTGVKFGSLDKFMSNGGSVGTGVAYATIFAALWETPSQVNQILNSIEYSTKAIAKQVKKPSNVKGLNYWHGEIWEAYVSNDGNLSSIAEQLGCDRVYLSKKLLKIGLPSLRGVSVLPVWRAYLKFEKGMSLLDACVEEDANPKEVEALVRLSCARVASAARTVIKNKKIKPQPDKEMNPGQLKSCENNQLDGIRVSTF